MLHIILYQPEIPPNTGNVIRLAANTGASLHLIEPLGFQLDDARLRRAGLDYHEYASLRTWPDLPTCLEALGQPRCFALTTRGRATPCQTQFADGDALLFGCETRGLPEEIRDSFAPERLSAAHPHLNEEPRAPAPVRRAGSFPQQDRPPGPSCLDDIASGVPASRPTPSY